MMFAQNLANTLVKAVEPVNVFIAKIADFDSFSLLLRFAAQQNVVIPD